MADIPLKCTCGRLRGVIDSFDSKRNMHVICLCDDCQAFAHSLGRSKDVLDANGGTPIIPIAPAHMKITQGQEHLQCLRLTEKGIIRWFAGCCRTPIANTPPIPGIPYVGVIRAFMDDAGDRQNIDKLLGPVRMRLMGKFGIGTVPDPVYPGPSLKVILQFLPFLIKGRLKGEQNPSPFFVAKTRRLTVEPYVLTRTERDNLRKFCGPLPTA